MFAIQPRDAAVKAKRTGPAGPVLWFLLRHLVGWVTLVVFYVLIDLLYRLVQLFLYISAVDNILNCLCKCAGYGGIGGCLRSWNGDRVQLFSEYIEHTAGFVLVPLFERTLAGWYGTIAVGHAQNLIR